MTSELIIIRILIALLSDSRETIHFERLIHGPRSMLVESALLVPFCNCASLAAPFVRDIFDAVLRHLSQQCLNLPPQPSQVFPCPLAIVSARHACQLSVLHPTRSLFVLCPCHVFLCLVYALCTASDPNLCTLFSIPASIFAR